jgi:hypothetical protein
MSTVNEGTCTHSNSQQTFELSLLHASGDTGEHLIASSESINAPTKNSQITERERSWELLLTSGMLLGPTLGIPLILLAFVFYTDKRVTFNEHGTRALPVNLSSISNSSYFTSIRATKFVLVSSWASTVSQFVIPPFMLPFSFFIAREITRQCDAPSTIQEISDHM